MLASVYWAKPVVVFTILCWCVLCFCALTGTHIFFKQRSLRPADGQTRSEALPEEGIHLVELPLGFKKKQNQAQTVQTQLSSFKHNQAYLVQT
jgi:hypothetical protein